MDKGSIYIRTIKGKEYFYSSYREGKKSVSKYIGPVGSERCAWAEEEYNRRKRLQAYAVKMSRISNSWEDCKHKSFVFPKTVECSDFDIERVHPLHQAGAASIFNAVAHDERIDRVVLFGSSTTVRCHGKSDYDILVKLKDEFITVEMKNAISERIQDSVDWMADIIWYDRVDKESALFSDVKRGVSII